MQAIILAAGMGTRLKALTAHNTKCMVEVNGVTLIERMLGQLDTLGLSRIVLVVGYEADKLKNYLATLNVSTPIVFVENPIYGTTNNIYSLALAKDYLVAEDSLLLESDLIFDDSVLHALVEDPRPSLALVDTYESWMDGTVVMLGQNDTIKDFIEKRKFRFEDISSYYKTVNIYKFDREFSEHVYVPFLDAYVSALGKNAYYEQVLRIITLAEDPSIRAKRLDGQLWYEIDDLQDLDIAASMFAEPARRIEALQERYGGYWRYPKLVDFCYLVNPCFPPQRLIDEMKASFERLVTQYPSGMSVNALLAAKSFGVSPSCIVVGNGAAELIKSLMESEVGNQDVTKKIGVVRPTFEEYPHRIKPEKLCAFVPSAADFSFTVDELCAFFEERDIEDLVIVNPDNPTGHYLSHSELIRLLAWAETRKKGSVRLIVDESFVDFADEKNASLIDEGFLQAHPSCVVIKSISKSYGVPGLRLGVLASGDKALIARLKNDLSIWNINSLAEFYLQIEEKYHGDYQAALDEFRSIRAEFVSGLKRIEGLAPLPTQANYVMIELCGSRGPCDSISATQLTQNLFEGYGLFIKDLTNKLQDLRPEEVARRRQFVRVSIRGRADNERLLRALEQELMS
ncbi:MAG: aminotransferase class I/II-fold pyridoxal phosphate-dependent enzyme [Coriobacteriales bacterium]|nr:aminotransferase class I/II-fold pyridoxal phosphate-dependent enzyme [Coriobacteriales bacterium]